jgi:cell division protein FtsZ
LLDEISLHGAKGVLINITGGYDLTLFELDEAANIIREKVDPDANIIVGSTLDTTMEGVLRVSVVATGIDAAVNRAEQPATRRSMAEPLKPAAPAPEARVTVSPVLTHVTMQQAPVIEVQAPAADLFQPHQQSFHHEPEIMIEDDMPAPAYRPAMQQPAPRPQAPLSLDNDAGSFVAPRPRAAGSPSPEALARLQAAVSKSPAQQAARQPMQQPRAAAPAPVAKPAERPRFGIGNLINRMAGGHSEQQERSQSGRQQPPVTAYDDEPELSADQERIEIPAFLRRQAN